MIELRQYTLHPGKRDELIALFEREFIESQEAVGMKVVGTFRDLDRSDRFVWIRADMPSRAEGLTAFYGGPVWPRHRDAAKRYHDQQRQRALAPRRRPQCRVST